MEPSTSKEINIDTVLIGEMDLFPDDHKDPQAAVKIETSHDESADQMDINVSMHFSITEVQHSSYILISTI